MSRRVAWGVAVAWAASLGGCAWARRENRPVWNFVEQHLVPDDGTWFWLALPATVPMGLGAIVADTFVAHPLQVVDDAAADAAKVWRRFDLDEHYYHQAAVLPVRVVGTPIAFTWWFLVRSAFDIEPDTATGGLPRDERQRRTAEWLAAIAGGRDEAPTFGLPGEPDETLRARLAEAWQTATALGRLQLYAAARGARWLADAERWRQGLEDASAVVRHEVLRWLPRDVEVPSATWDRLGDDVDPVVRERARAAARERRR